MDLLSFRTSTPIRFLAKRLQDVGTATVMPLGSPIGSNRGLETRAQIEIIIKQAAVPVVVDAGIGAPSHAAEALEMGADAVLVNTAIAAARDPVRMAKAFKAAVECAREAFEAGLPSQLDHAEATSPLAAFLKQSAELGEPSGPSGLMNRMGTAVIRPRCLTSLWHPDARRDLLCPLIRRPR